MYTRMPNTTVLTAPAPKAPYSDVTRTPEEICNRDTVIYRKTESNNSYGYYTDMKVNDDETVTYSNKLSEDECFNLFIKGVVIHSFNGDDAEYRRPVAFISGGFRFVEDYTEI